jgi:hypothetical protein
MQRYFKPLLVSALVCACASVMLTACYKESNVLSDLPVTVKGYAALIDAFTISAPGGTPGTAINASVTTRTFEGSIKEIKIYSTVGSASRTLASSTAVSIAASSIATVQVIPYTIPATAAKGTTIVLSVGVVTDNSLENIFTTTRAVTVR